jgi:hypothetical protein
MKSPKKKRKGVKRKAAAPRRKNISFRKYKKALNKKHAPALARLYQSFRKEEQRIVRARGKKARVSNPKKAKTGRWYKGPRGTKVRVRRARGKIIVDVK